MTVFTNKARAAIAAAGALAAVALGLGGAGLTAALAAEDAHAPEHHHWHFAGPFGRFDRAALQRGYQVYREVCASCHGMQYVSFRNLAQPGGPYYDPDYPNPNDNPTVRALAAEFTIEDGEDAIGDPIERAGRTGDAFPDPFINETAARASNGGALPPDLSVIIKARHHGPDYVRSFLLGYRDPPADVELRPGSYYNPWFAGGLVAMPDQLFDGRVEYADGTEATPEQMAEDVVEFLTWASDPHTEARKRLGFMVIAYLSILAVLLWFSYRMIWRNVKH